MYSCIVIDDQPEAVELLKNHINNTPKLKLKAATTDPTEALSFLDTELVDIIFLDVQMPVITGVEIIENLSAKWGHRIPKIVFTTGYSEYAISAFDHGIADYLLKPVSYSRFRKAADRIIRNLEQHRGQTVTTDFVFVDVDGKKIKINFDDIIYIEGARNYIIIATTRQRLITYKSMNGIYETLPRDRFIRIHKSYIIAIDKIQAIRGNEICVQVKEEGKYIPLGITHRERVLKQLKIII